MEVLPYASGWKDRWNEIDTVVREMKFESLAEFLVDRGGWLVRHPQWFSAASSFLLKHFVYVYLKYISLSEISFTLIK